MHYPLPILQTIGLSYRVFWLGLGRFVGLVLLIMLVSLIVAVPVVVAQLSGASPGKIAAIQGVATLVQIVPQVILQMAMFVIAARIVEGQTCRIGEAISQTAGRFFPILGVGLVQTIIVMLGMLLLIVPGVIFALMLAVALPAAILERLGVGESLSRSRALTSGQKWRIFGLGLVIMLAFVGVLTVAGLIAAVGLPKDIGAIVTALIAFLAILALVPLGATLPPVLFMQLRALHDGHAHIG